MGEMTNQISSVIAVLVILAGQAYALLEKEVCSLFLAVIIGGVFTVASHFSETSSAAHWALIRLREVIRYLLVWTTFPILSILLLSLGGAYAVGTLIAIPLMIYHDRRFVHDKYRHPN